MYKWTKSKKNTKNNKTEKNKNPCRSQELKPGHLAPKADALPLHHRVNREYRLLEAILLFPRNRSKRK